MTTVIHGALMLGLLLPASALAQHETPLRLRTLLDSVRSVAQQVDYATARPVSERRRQAVDSVLRASSAADLTLPELAAAIRGGHAGFGIVSRWRPGKVHPLAADWFAVALTDLLRIVNSPQNGIAAVAEGRLPRDRLDAALAPAESLSAVVQAQAQGDLQRILAAFAAKYGPGSAALNGPEVVLNYLAQFTPMLGPQRDGRPSPWEIVAAYRTSELTASRDDQGKTKVRIVSGLRLGLRHYDLSPAAGAGNRVQRMLRPGYWSAGAFFMGPRDAPLDRAWGSESRPGLFLGWGEAHLSVVFGNDRRVVIGTGAQILPYVF